MPNLGHTTFAAVVLATLATLATGCQPDDRRDAELISEPQLSTQAQGDSIAPLFEMSNPRRLHGRYIVRFKRNAIDVRGLTESLISRHGGRVYEVLPGLGAFWGELPDAAIGTLRRNPSIAYIEADVAVPVSGLRDSVQTNPRWPLDRVDQRTLPLNGRYEYSVVGSGVRIWIVDTGVDRGAPDLAGRIDESWYVTNNGKDPYAPCHSHGTNVATTAAGHMNGVAKGAIIHSARVDADCTGGLSTGAASFAFEFIGNYSPRPAVINFSAGKECHWLGCGPTVDDAAKYARQKGVTVIVAAGNDGNSACNYSPAHVPELLTVAASNASDQRVVIPGWWSSNWGSCVDIFAPVEDAGGTSNAAPMVTGAAALHLQLYPSATPSAVEAAILAKSTKGVLVLCPINILPFRQDTLYFSPFPRTGESDAAWTPPEAVGPVRRSAGSIGVV